MGVYKREEIWYIDYYVDGRRRRETIGPSKSLAKEVLSKRLTEVADRKYFPDRQAQAHPVTFDEFIETYWERHWKRLLGNGGAFIKKSLVAAFGGRTFDRITPGLVQDYYN